MDWCTVMHHCLAFTLINDVVICITMLQTSNNVRQSRCPVEWMNIHTCPRGKHGFAIRYHFSSTT